MREKTIENALKKGVEMKKGLCVKIPGSSFSGFPDRVVLIPGGKVYFIETKAPTGKASKLQIHVHKKLRAMDFEVFVIFTHAQVASFLNLLTAFHEV